MILKSPFETDFYSVVFLFLHATPWIYFSNFIVTRVGMISNPFLYLVS